MNVVHLASSAELGGAERVILDILGGLHEACPTWRLHLIVPDEGALAHRARVLGVEVVVLRMDAGIARLGDVMTSFTGLFRVVWRMARSGRGIVAYALALRRTLRRCSPDIVHAHGFKMQMLAMWTRPSGVALVLHLHDYVRQRPVMSRLFRLPLRRPVVAAAISESVARDVTEATGGRLRIDVIHNGVDVAHWSPEGPVADLDALSGMAPAPPRTVRVGLVATFARWKGHEVFLEALRHLRTGASVRGYVVGGSIYRTDRSQHDVDELRATAARMGIATMVGFTGFVEDPAAAMRGLDVVVHASTLPEPFGLVVVEGMALQRAVISTGTGGAAELIVPDVTALAVPPGDGAALARAINRLVDDPEQRARLGREGRARVLRLFDRRDMARSVARLYESVVAAPRAGG